jgi:hypothetical protein
VAAVSQGPWVKSWPGLLHGRFAKRRPGILFAFDDVMLLLLIIFFFALALGGGAWGHSRIGYVGWSPAGLIALILLVLLLTGNLRI